jgi:hypothetical protein
MTLVCTSLVTLLLTTSISVAQPRRLDFPAKIGMSGLMFPASQQTVLTKFGRPDSLTVFGITPNFHDTLWNAWYRGSKFAFYRESCYGANEINFLASGMTATLEGIPLSHHTTRAEFVKAYDATLASALDTVRESLLSLDFTTPGTHLILGFQDGYLSTMRYDFPE